MGCGRGSWPDRWSILVSMATATAVSLLVYLTDIAHGLGGLGDSVQSGSR